MDRSQLSTLVRSLHGDAIAGVDRALGRGTAILLTRVGDGERELVREGSRPIVELDATLYPERTALRFELLRTVVTRLLGADPRMVLADLGPSGDRARLSMAEAYGDRARHVMALLEREAPPPPGQMRLSLPEVLAGAEDDVALVVFDAHRLDTDARWDLRELDRPLLLVTRPDHLGSLTSDDAPFYGQGQTFAVQMPGAREWMRALETIGVLIHPADLEWLLVRSRARAVTTFRALELVIPERSPRTAWRLAVRDSLSHAHDVLALARAVHAYAPPLLVAIAEGRRPYTAVPGAASARVALALRKLHVLDILEQPEPRSWQIADPLLEHALRSVTTGARMGVAAGATFDDG